MSRKKDSAASDRGLIYTLAQNGTDRTGEELTIVSGKGSDLNNQKALKGRAKRKVITQSMVLSLIDVVNQRGDLVRRKGYWNTYHCQSRIHTADGRLYGKYCKNRHCTLCACIRKAKIINKYLPFIQSWPDPHFVTLTIRARTLPNLVKFMAGMNKAFQKIYSKLKKRSQRGRGEKMMGIKSLECNFNPQTKKYNPHFHLIVPNKATGEILINEWLRIWTPKYALRVGQKSERVFSNQKALIEVVKYGSKIFTEPDLSKQAKKTPGSAKIYAAALDNIFRAMKGMRIFERFGFNLPKTQTGFSNTTLVKGCKEWRFDIAQYDWIDQTGAKLSDYRPEVLLLHLLTNSIDTTTG